MRRLMILQLGRARGGEIRLHLPAIMAFFSSMPTQTLALERISNGLDYLPSWWLAPSQLRGSPTRHNNQILQNGVKDENCLSLSSQVVSLNGDGVLDVLEVQLTDNAWRQGGYRIDVFSMAGHHCKQIAYAEVGGAQDHWHWDGSTDDGGVLPPDFYYSHNARA